jgi:hypothetical protein
VNFIGDIAYNAAQTSNECDSGISIYEPIVADYATGTHIYIAQATSATATGMLTLVLEQSQRMARESSLTRLTIRKVEELPT